MSHLQDKCYSILRNTKGLGYIVKCYSTQTHDSGFFNILIQSARFHPHQILNEIKTFLETFYRSVILSKKFKQEFYKVLKSIQNYFMPDGQTATSLSLINWNSIKKGDTSINLRHLQFKSLRRLTPKKFKDFYSRMFFNRSSMKVLSAVLYGKGKVTKLDVDCDISYYSIDPIDSKLDSACT